MVSGASSSGQGRDERAEQAALAAIPEFLAKLFKELDACIPVPEPSRLRVVRLFTFADAVKYFAENDPGDSRIRGGALLRRPHARGQVIYQVFLDQANHVCLDTNRRAYGRTFVTQSIDDELAGKFDDSELIIFT
jgi:hypothetical protein